MRALILAVLSFVTGCASTTKARLQNIPLMRPGISKADVLDRFGEPDQVLKRAGKEIWRYSVYSDDSAHIYPYRAEMEKDVLQSFEPDSGYVPRAKKYARRKSRIRSTTSVP